jgi:peptidoglycan/xylan/chitin deacetylase (PgdA/CDA1 family)
MPVRFLAIGVAISLAACGLNQTPPVAPTGQATPWLVTPMASSASPSASQPVASAVPPASVPPASPPAIGPVVPARSLPSYVNHGSRTKKWIALTFDADMYAWMYTERDRVSLVDRRIVDLLEKTHTPATIFLNGLFAEAYPSLIKRLGGDPTIELANHSWDHAGWTADCPNTTPIRPPMTERTEVIMTEAIVSRLTGVQVHFFRFPGFCRTSREVGLVRTLGEHSIGSDCFFGDTLGWSARRQIASVERGCTRGSIVVTHLNGPPFHPNVYEALETLIPWWKAHGWTIVTVGRLLGDLTPRPGG